MIQDPGRGEKMPFGLLRGCTGAEDAGRSLLGPRPRNRTASEPAYTAAMPFSFSLHSPQPATLSGVIAPLALGQAGGDASAAGPLLWAVAVLVALAAVLLLTVLLLLLIGGGRRARRQSEAARHRRTVTVGEDAWEEAGRRCQDQPHDPTGDADV